MVRERFGPSKSGFMVEKRENQLRFQRSDGDEDRRPDEGSGFEQCHLDNEHSVRWRGIVGTLVAALCGLETHNKIWHFADWPEGYTMWTKPRSKERNRYDYYLYGRRVGSYRSPIEFVLHAYYLFSDGENARDCRCNNCTNRAQGVVNREVFGLDRIRRVSDPGAVAQQVRHPHQVAGGGAGGGARNHANRGEPGIADGTSVAQAHSILALIQAANNNRARRTPNPERLRDQTDEVFRVDELVWASIPPIQHPHRNDLEIRFWPAIVNSRDLSVTPLGRSNHYLVVLLGVGKHHHDCKENSLLPYLAHQWPPALVDELASARPPVAVGEELEELHGFQPLPIRETPPRLARNHANALAPLAVAKWTSDSMSNYRIPRALWENSPTDREGKTYPHYEGCWVGPEMLWEEDMARVALNWDELEVGPWRQRLLPKPADSQGKGIIMKIKFFTQVDDQCFASGTLHELVPIKPGNRPPRDYPLPAPAGYQFRPISKPDHSVRLRLMFLAGRYYSGEFMNARLDEAQRQDESGRISAMSSLKPAHGTGSNPSREWTERDKASRFAFLTAISREARRTYYELWEDGMYD